MVIIGAGAVFYLGSGDDGGGVEESIQFIIQSSLEMVVLLNLFIIQSSLMVSAATNRDIQPSALAHILCFLFIIIFFLHYWSESPII